MKESVLCVYSTVTVTHKSFQGGYMCEAKEHTTLHTILQHREFSAVVFPYLAHMPTNFIVY
jgi:hypothetical protein